METFNFNRYFDTVYGRVAVTMLQSGGSLSTVQLAWCHPKDTRRLCCLVDEYPPEQQRQAEYQYESMTAPMIERRISLALEAFA